MGLAWRGLSSTMRHSVAIFEELPQLVEISCVNLQTESDLCESVRAVGGIFSGISWSLPQGEAIAAIDAGRFRFVVRSHRSTTAVLIASAEGGRRYLKGAWDGAIPTTLLALPNCCPLRSHPPHSPSWLDTLSAPYGYGPDPRFWLNRYIPGQCADAESKPCRLDLFEQKAA